MQVSRIVVNALIVGVNVLFVEIVFVVRRCMQVLSESPFRVSYLVCKAKKILPG